MRLLFLYLIMNFMLEKDFVLQQGPAFDTFSMQCSWQSSRSWLLLGPLLLQAQCSERCKKISIILSMGTFVLPLYCPGMAHLYTAHTLAASDCRNSLCNCLLMQSRGHLCFLAGSSCTGMQRNFLILHLLFSKVHKNLCEESRKISPSHQLR